MKLLSVTTARAIWLFDIQDMNPKGKSIFPDLLDWLKGEYHFQKFPKSTADRDEHGGLAFSEGDFQIKEEIFDVAMSIYNDGLVATTQSSTDESEAFLVNVLDLACKEFSLKFDTSMIRRRMYLSEINVILDGSLSRINPNVEAISEEISAALSLDKASGFQLTGLILGADLTTLPPSKQVFSGFVIERKVGAPFSENRFWSKAPLPTNRHLELLNQFEKILT
ncbi:MAG: hypothetical protein LAN62_12765 [Acidobacteriia bacterium]|nr:hypothetical protein [Terriglobia bacterium]